MKTIAALVMSFPLTLIYLMSWIAMGISIVVASFLTLPIWAYQEYKDLTKDGRG